MIHDEQLLIIHNMMLKYTKKADSELFEQILSRVDDALVGMVYKISKRQRLTDPNIQDLYQCAILGLYKAIAATTPIHDPYWVLGRIHSYVRNAILQKYAPKKLSLYSLPAKSENPPIDAHIIQEERLKQITKLVDQGKITAEDLELLKLKVVEGLSVRQIVDTSFSRWGKTWHTVNKRIENTLKQLRVNMEEKDE